MPKIIGRVPGLMDEDCQPLYDRLLYTSAATLSLRFFTVAIGGVKTLVDTNMSVAGELPQPQSFRCYGMSFILGPGANAGVELAPLDIWGLMFNAQVIFHVGEKDKHVGNGIFYPSGAGVSGFGYGTAAAAVERGNFGVADPRAIFTFSKPIPIGVSINFYVEASWPAGAVTLARGNAKLMCVLHGELSRGVF